MLRNRTLVLAGLSILLLVISGTVKAQAIATTGDPHGRLESLERFWLDAYGSAGGKSIAMLGAGEPFASMQREMLAKAQPDACYGGIGVPMPAGPPCAAGVPKVNQAYVWGLTKKGHDLWFGTAPNVHCLVLGGYLGMTIPHETDAWVCEFGESLYSPPLPAAAGDWRPARIFVYDMSSKGLTEMSPIADPRFMTTSGLRSAGVLNKVVFLAGPSLLGGINLFAFNAKTRSYLGSINLPEYDNIRKWLVAGDALYTAVGNTGGGGSILRWTGSVTTPFLFEKVGETDGAGAELAFHEGRIFVSTWPTLGSSVAGLWMSPVVPPGGLGPAHAASWEKVWQVSDYEADPVTAATYGGGALESFDGYLYWGTMHVPFLAGVAHFNVYGQPADGVEALTALLGTHRAISIFRGRDFGTAGEQVQLLYGMPMMPAYAPGDGWKIVPNNMAQMPLYGLAGFGNFFNNYTWTMAVYHDQLMVGTMDWSIIFNEMLSPLLASILGYDPGISLEVPTQFVGADLFRFPSSFSHAMPERLSGVGNYANYGIRTMITGDNELFLGTANPMNLMTDPQGLMMGGWELLKLQAGD